MKITTEIALKIYKAVRYSRRPHIFANEVDSSLPEELLNARFDDKSGRLLVSTVAQFGVPHFIFECDAMGIDDLLIEQVAPNEWGLNPIKDYKREVLRLAARSKEQVEEEKRQSEADHRQMVENFLTWHTKMPGGALFTGQ